MPSYRRACDDTYIGCFQLPSNGFPYFEIGCFLKFKPIGFSPFCLIVTT